MYISNRGEDKGRSAIHGAVLQGVGGASWATTHYPKDVLATIARDVRPGKLAELVQLITGAGQAYRIEAIRADAPEPILAGNSRRVADGEEQGAAGDGTHRSEGQVIPSIDGGR